MVQLTTTYLLISLCIASTIYYTLAPASACVKSICGPIVSKCQLIGACRCVNINNTCYEECGQCLTENFYNDCCSCVEICPQPPENDTEWGSSSVDVIDEANPELFETLTSLPDSLNRWQEYHEPVTAPKTNFDPLPDSESGRTDINQNGTTISPSNSTDTVIPPLICTVAYFKCSLEIFKCHDACKTIGASAYRWFYDGCCECVGQYCRNFGSNISRCGPCTVADGHQQEL